MCVVFCTVEWKDKLSHKLNYLLILIRDCHLTSHTGNDIMFFSFIHESLSYKAFLHAHTLLLSLKVNQEGLILVLKPNKLNISGYRKMWVVFLFFLGSKTKKTKKKPLEFLGEKERPWWFGNSYGYGFWGGEAPQNFPGGLVVLKNLSMHSLVHLLGVRLRPLGSLNPHTNAALLGKSPKSFMLLQAAQQSLRSGAVQGSGAPASAHVEKKQF